MNKFILRIFPVLGVLALVAQKSFAYTLSLTPDATTTQAVSTLSETFFPLWMQAIAFIIALYGAAWILIMVVKGVRWLWSRATSLGGR